jgi:hypothetical protein
MVQHNNYMTILSLHCNAPHNTTHTEEDHDSTTNSHVHDTQVADAHLNFDASIARLRTMTPKQLRASLVFFYTKMRDDSNFKAERTIIWPMAIDSAELPALTPGGDPPPHPPPQAPPTPAKTTHPRAENEDGDNVAPPPKAARKGAK